MRLHGSAPVPLTVWLALVVGLLGLAFVLSAHLS